VKTKEKRYVRYIYSRTLENAKNRIVRWRKGIPTETFISVNPDSSLKEEIAAGDMGYVSWGDLPEELENAVFSMHVGEISDPIRSGPGFYVLRVDSVRRDVFLTEYDFSVSRSRIAKVIRRRKEARRSNQFIRDFMGSKNVVLKKEIFNHLSNLLYNSAINRDRISNRAPLIIGPQIDRELGIISNKLADRLDEVLVEYKGGERTVRDFLDRYRIEPLKMRGRTPEAFKNRLKDVIGIFVRDNLLAEEGRRRKLHKRESVKLEATQWKERLIADRMRRVLTDTLTVTDEELRAYYQLYRDKYRGSEFDPVRETVRRDCLNDKREKVISDFVARLRGEIPVSVNREVLASIRSTDEGLPRKIDFIGVRLQ
ncbi:MAG: peptidyl-prolyl cis-trans isomerase, partial [Fidelibacterota bacterium]